MDAIRNAAIEEVREAAYELGTHDECLRVLGLLRHYSDRLLNSEGLFARHDAYRALLKDMGDGTEAP